MIAFIIYLLIINYAYSAYNEKKCKIYICLHKW